MSIDNIKKIAQFNNESNIGKSKNAVESPTEFTQILNSVVASNKKTDLEDIFAKAAATYDVPEELLKAVAKAESGFNPGAVSKCGAMGVMQLMPATAQALGVTNTYDPEQNIMGGAKYLSQKLQAYDGNITLALASYNAGSGNVAKYGGVPPFPETQKYITKVMGYMGENVELPDQISWGSGDLNSSGMTTNSDQTFSEMGSEKAYYASQLQILKHQLQMQEVFAATFSNKDERSDNYSANLSDLFMQG